MDNMTPPEYALRVLRETTARALAGVRCRKPFSPEVERLVNELSRIDRDLTAYDKKKRAS